jgi:hypothetical protein
VSRGLALAAAGAVGVAVAVAWTTGGRWVAARAAPLLAAASRAAGREVSAGGARMTLWPGPGIVFRDVRVTEDARFGADAPFLVARRVAFYPRLLPLVRGRLVVDRVVVDAPEVRLVRDADGRLNVDSLGRRPRRRPPGAVPAPRPARAKRPRLRVAVLRLRDGIVRWDDRAASRALTLTAVSVALDEPRRDGPVPVHGSARVAAGGVTLERAVTAGMLDVHARTYRGTLAARGALGPVAFDVRSATVEATPATLLVDAVSAALLGGTAAGSARLATAGPGAGLGATLALRDVRLGDVAPFAGPRGASGTLALTALLAVPARGGALAWDAGIGDARVLVRGGRVRGLRVGRALLDVVGPFLEPGTGDALRTRHPELFGEDLAFARLAGAVRLRRGAVRSDALAVDGRTWTAAARGAVGLDGTLDVAIRLSAEPALVRDLIRPAGLRAMLAHADGRLAVPLHVRGTLAHPRVSADVPQRGRRRRAG